MTTAPDPVFCEDGSWYFCDEVQAGRYGPFASKQEARDEFALYCVVCRLNVPYPEDDDGIRKWWRQRGGRFHGPKIKPLPCERATITEEDLLATLRQVFQHANSLERQCDKLFSKNQREEQDQPVPEQDESDEPLSGRVMIPVAAMEFDVGGHTIWIQSPSGATVLRIKATGKITVERCTISPVSHADLMVEGDIHICCSKDVMS